MNKMNNSQGNIVPELNCHTIASHEYFNTAEAQANNLLTNFMKMIDVLKKEMKKSPLKKSRKTQRNN